ncbi:hypothetical protein CEN43_15635, partial [Fischerella thermalis BR2B]
LGALGVYGGSSFISILCNTQIISFKSTPKLINLQVTMKLILPATYTQLQTAIILLSKKL